MANTCECSINIVSDNKPKGMSQAGLAGRLEPKRQRSGYKDFSLSCHGQSTLPVDRAYLTHSIVMAAEHGNPVCLSQGKANRKGSLWMCGHERMEEAKAAL